MKKNNFKDRILAHWDVTEVLGLISARKTLIEIDYTTIIDGSSITVENLEGQPHNYIAVSSYYEEHLITISVAIDWSETPLTIDEKDIVVDEEGPICLIDHLEIKIETLHHEDPFISTLLCLDCLKATNILIKLEQ